MKAYWTKNWYLLTKNEARIILEVFRMYDFEGRSVTTAIKVARIQLPVHAFVYPHRNEKVLSAFKPMWMAFNKKLRQKLVIIIMPPSPHDTVLLYKLNSIQVQKLNWIVNEWITKWSEHEQTRQFNSKLYFYSFTISTHRPSPSIKAPSGRKYHFCLSYHSASTQNRNSGTFNITPECVYRNELYSL